MDYNVSILQLELTNKCNANCIFCKRDSKQGFMDIELFNKRGCLHRNQGEF